MLLLVTQAHQSEGLAQQILYGVEGVDGPLVESDGGVSVETIARIVERASDVGEAQDEMA